MRLPVPAIVTLFVLSFLIDLYIWFDISRKKSVKKDYPQYGGMRHSFSTPHKRSGKGMGRGRTIYLISSLLMWGFLIFIVALPKRGQNGGIYPVMWMLTAYISIYAAKIVYCIFSLLGRIPDIFGFGTIRWMRYVGLVAGLAVIAMIAQGIFWTRKHIQTIGVTLSSSRLPESFDGYTIAQISDLHLGTWGNDTVFVSNLVDSVNALNPDLIVFTGDIVNQKSEEMKPFIPVLKRLRAKDGVYSILGNHDYGDYVDWPSKEAKADNLEQLKQYQADAGWKMLNNDYTFLSRGDDTIALIGVENWGEPPFGQYGDIDKAYPATKYTNLKDQRFKILLTHNPEHWVRETSRTTNIDLALSGHTHAMQMCWDLFGRRWSPSALRYPTWGGFYTKDAIGMTEDFGNPETKHGLERTLDRPGLYVNIGSGEVAMPYRLGSSNPEITLFTLHRK